MKLADKHNELIMNYKGLDTVISNRLKDFSIINKKEDLFYELCFCLLTPQSNAKRCDEAAKILREKGLYNGKINLSDIRKILQTRTRFHNNKGKYVYNLKEKFEVLYNEFDLEKKSSDPFMMREWLVKNVKGLGLKEASHFLRNVGFRNLAILDRHILRNLNKLDVISEVPRSLTKKQYFLIEKEFINFSKSVGLNMDNLDLYFWCAETGEVFK